MKNITFTMMSMMLTATALSANPTIRTEDLQQKKIEEKMYSRNDSEIKSLAFMSKDELIKKGDDAEGKEHIEVGSRAMPHAEYVATQEQRVAQSEEEVSEVVYAETPELVKKELDDEELIPRKTYYNSHESAYHCAIGVTYLGDQVTLEDSSVWNVASWDQWKTLNWLTSDTILLMQNKWLFSSYKFMLVNQNTGKEVEVNLCLGPIYSGAYTHWIAGIDYFNDQVILEDGSVWDMSFWDSSVVGKWLINDTVIVGVNEASSVTKPNILINVNMVNYARGICLN